jgi:hypothetical protein
MTYGGDYLYSVLSASTELLAYIGTSLYNGTMVPTTDDNTESVNFYRVGSFDGGQEWFRQEWSVDCRAKDEKTSRAIAWEAFQALNRASGNIAGFTYFGVASVGQTVPPISTEDVYNTPVTVILRRR